MAEAGPIGAKATGSESLSYASALKRHMSHASVSQFHAEVQQAAMDARKGERIELELVAAAAHFKKYAMLNPTRPSVDESLPPDLYRSCTGFLISRKAASFTLDVNKMQREIGFFSKRAIIAYFVGGGVSSQAQRAWLNFVTKNK